MVIDKLKPLSEDELIRDWKGYQKIPLVSVTCISYNHERYIADALDGIFAQKTNFPFEVIVHDDASTDKTQDIIKKYAEKYPRVLVPILQKENYWLGKEINATTTIVWPSAKGKYIAWIEGDDYWTDPLKLQKQVDFLEANPGYGMVCTDYNKFFEKTKKLKYSCLSPRYLREGEIIFNDYIFDKSNIATASVLFRKDLLDSYINEIGFEQISQWNVGDTPIWLYIAGRSKIKVLNEITTVYRINENSASKFTDIDKRYEFRIKGYEIPIFFVEYFNVSDKIKRKVLEGYKKLYIRYRYDAQNEKIGFEEYEALKINKSLDLDDKIRYYFYKNHNIAEYFLLPISKSIRKIKRELNI